MGTNLELVASTIAEHRMELIDGAILLGYDLVV